MKRMRESTFEIERRALFDRFGEMSAFVEDAFRGGTAHDVDSGLWQRVLRLGHDVLQARLDLFGDGDAGERIALEDGREVRLLVDLHRREIRNVLGLFEPMRAVCGTREGRKIGENWGQTTINSPGKQIAQLAPRPAARCRPVAALRRGNGRRARA